MAKATIFLEGLDSAIADFDRLGLDIETSLKSSFERELTKIEIQMQSNALGMFEDSAAMVASIGHSVGFKNGTLSSSVGVYDMPSKAGTEDRIVSGRRITAPMLALFYETGIAPHSTASGASLAKADGRQAKGQDKGGIHPGHAPVPFMSNAFDTMAPAMMEQVLKDLDEKILQK